jgi:hypothetical protein
MGRPRAAELFASSHGVGSVAMVAQMACASGLRNGSTRLRRSAADSAVSGHSTCAARYPIGVALFAGRQCSAGVPHRPFVRSDAARPPPADPQTRGVRGRSSRQCALRARAEPSEFEIDRGVRAESTRVTGIKTMIAIVATGTSIAGPVMAFEAGAIIAPIPLLSWPIVPARLIFKTLGVTRIHYRVKPANNVANPLGEKRVA